MDPNETLRMIREAIKAWQDEPAPRARAGHAEDALEAFQDLDNWLTVMRGFLPAAWSHSTEF